MAPVAAPPRPSVRTRVRVPLRGAAGDPVDTEMVTFHGLTDGEEHLAVVRPWPGDLPTVRIHSECLTGDVFGSLLCDCGDQLGQSLDMIAAHGGIVLYLRQEGRGIGLYGKLDAYRLQARHGLDTFEANAALGFAEDGRDFGAAAEMLDALGVAGIELLTNNPDKTLQLLRDGVDVVRVRPTCTFRNDHNAAYLTAKRTKARHTLATEERDDQHAPPGAHRPDQRGRDAR